MVDLPDLSLSTFLVIENFFSLVFATFFGTAIYMFVSRRDLAKRYRSSVAVSGVVLSIAAYHYFRIFNSFNGAYDVEGSMAIANGEVFNEAYRYMDWIITVPLLVVELILVLGLARERRRDLMIKLVPASFAMIALGYPGELTSESSAQWLWWALAMIPFIYILYVLFTEITAVINDQPAEVRGLLNLVRSTLVVTWLFYPIAYIFPIVLENNGTTLALENIGYAIADITAKAGYGLVIYMIAKRKSEIEESVSLDASPATV